MSSGGSASKVILLFETGWFISSRHAWSAVRAMIGSSGWGSLSSICHG